jgi:hypothetical protein
MNCVTPQFKSMSKALQSVGVVTTGGHILALCYGKIRWTYRKYLVKPVLKDRLAYMLIAIKLI